MMFFNKVYDSSNDIGYEEKMIRCKNCLNYGNVEEKRCDCDGQYKSKNVKRTCKNFINKKEQKEKEREK